MAGQPGRPGGTSEVGSPNLGQVHRVPGPGSTLQDGQHFIFLG
jgi:hypothetical protein